MYIHLQSSFFSLTICKYRRYDVCVYMIVLMDQMSVIIMRKNKSNVAVIMCMCVCSFSFSYWLE